MSGPNGDPHVLGGGTGDDGDEGGDTFEEEGAWGRAGPPSRRGSRGAEWPGLVPRAQGGRVQVCPDVLRCAQVRPGVLPGAVPDASDAPAPRQWGLRGCRV